MILFKVTGSAGESIHGGNGSWPLPQDGQPSEWLSVEGDLELCRNGLHGVIVQRLLQWYRNDARIWLMEIDIDAGVVCDTTKLAARRARLTAEITLDWPLLPLFPQAFVFLAMREAAKTGSGASLSGADLSGASLSGASLSGANLSRADLSRAHRPNDVPNGWTADTKNFLNKAQERVPS